MDIEHIVVPKGYESTYPYSADGKLPGGEYSPMPDPLIWLTWVAAHSTKVRLGTGILILPLRNPVVLAKEVATLDRLSGGRVTLGVGVGWLEEEFDAIGVPFAARGRRTDEHIAAMRELWTATDPTYSGEFVSFETRSPSPSRCSSRCRSPSAVTPTPRPDVPAASVTGSSPGCRTGCPSSSR